MTGPREHDHDGAEEEPRVRVTDRRRLDPESGEVRPGFATAPPATPAAEPETVGSPSDGGPAEGSLEAQLAERTEDLLRLKAEFDNYRRRVDRDRAAWGEAAVGRVLGVLLPALDDVDRARAHGELDGPFRSVSDQLTKALDGVGLERFGTAGEPFDPAFHEALTSVADDGVDREQVQEVYRAGYSFSGRVLRPAQVVVASPGPGRSAAGPAQE